MTQTFLGALVAITLTSGTAWAQLPSPSATEVLPREARFGTYISASFLVPNDGTYSKVAIQTDMPRVDLISSNTDIRFMVEVSDDDGQTWRNFGGAHYIGCDCPGRDGSPQKQPGVEATMTELGGKRVRMRMDIANSIRTGVTITLSN